VANPGDGDLAVGKLRKSGLTVLACSAGQQRFPDHFMEKSAGIEVFGRGQIFKRARERLSGMRGAMRRRFGHSKLMRLLLPRIE
jgi:hypothetical protein